MYHPLGGSWKRIVPHTNVFIMFHSFDKCFGVRFSIIFYSQGHSKVIHFCIIFYHSVHRCTWSFLNISPPNGDNFVQIFVYIILIKKVSTRWLKCHRVWLNNTRPISGCLADAEYSTYLFIYMKLHFNFRCTGTCTFMSMLPTLDNLFSSVLGSLVV